MAKEHESFTSSDKVFGTASVCEAAGCKPVTLRAWRRRNGLFPETWGGRNANHFSLLDICMVRMIVALTDHGLGADDAVRFVQGEDLMMGLDAYLMATLEGDRQDKVVGFSVSQHPPSRITFLMMGDGNYTLAEALKNTLGAATFINVRAIVDHVTEKLGLRALQVEEGAD